jgi:protein gp37
MTETGVEWATCIWSVVSGCTPVSAGCQRCWGRAMLRRMRRDPFKVVLHADKLNEPFSWRDRQRVFVAPMGDLFHEKVPVSFLEEVVSVIRQTPQHTYLLLTKRPQELLKPRPPLPLSRQDLRVPLWEALGFPLPNVWLGVTTENEPMAAERLPELLRIPAALYFASYEPALEAVDFSPWLVALPEWGPETCQRCDGEGTVVTCWDDLCANSDHCIHGDGEAPCPECGGYGEVSGPGRPGLSWLIVGGESGAGARPCDPAWIAAAVAQCREASVPVFVKQFGTAWARVNLRRRIRAGDPSQWPPGDWPREVPREVA